jgi:WD40 repeat protein
VLSNHKGWVRSVAFGPDGLKLVSTSGDRTVQVWDSTTEKCCMLKDHAGGVNCAVLSLDGSKIASGSGDGTVRFVAL